MNPAVFSVCKASVLFFAGFLIATVASEGFDTAITNDIILYGTENPNAQWKLMGTIVNGFKWQIVPIQPHEWANPVLLVVYAIEIRSKVPNFVLYPIFYGKTFTRKKEGGELLPIRHDTLVFANRENQETGWCGVHISGTPDNCNFNEIFICPFLQGKKESDWMNIKNDNSQSAFYRPSQISTWNVKTTTKFIFTKNEYVQIDIRTGAGWNSNCECVSGDLIVNALSSTSCAEHFNVFGASSNWGATRSWSRPVDVAHVACIRVKLLAGATCDLEPFRLGPGNLKSRSNAAEDRISEDVHLPALVEQAGMPEGANAYEISKNFDQFTIATNCKPGYTEVERPLFGKICRTPNLKKCNADYMMSCRFKNIADQCQEVFFTNIAKRDECILEKQKICQGYQILDVLVLDKDNCISTEGFCKNKGFNSHYYDLETSTCRECGKNMKDGNLVNFDRCVGANQGFQGCKKDEHYKWYTGATPYHGCSNVCGSGACSDMEYQVSACGNQLDVAGGVWYLRNDPRICRTCVNNCRAREFATCGGEVTPGANFLDTKCEDCFCTQPCNDEYQYCYMDPELCKGDSKNGRSECRDSPDVLCDVGYYNRNMTTPRRSEGKTYPYWTAEETKADTCIFCVTTPCNFDQFFPKCLTVGVANKPECQYCTNKPENSEYTGDILWDEYRRQQENVSLVRPECMWSCNNGYVRIEDECVPCTQTPLCEPGFKMQCVQEAFSENNRQCAKCFDEGGNKYCASVDGVRYFMELCTPDIDSLFDPTDLLQDEADEKFMNLCQLCATKNDSDCSPTQYFSECDARGANIDNSGCVECVTLLPNNAIARDVEENQVGIVCDWGCKPDYYREQNGKECTLCSQSLEESCFCSGNTCKGLRLSGCEANFSVSDRVCECLPGYNMDNNGRCIICTNNKFSPGGLSLCSACPQGHESNTEIGGTFCVPCTANTFKTNGVCRLCDTGTDGVIASNVCKTCIREGERAFADIWTGRIKLYGSTFGLVSAEISDGFIGWSGMIPMTCDGGGTNGSFSICEDDDASSIVTRVEFNGRWYQKTQEQMSPSYTCQICPLGLAYSTNFDFATAYRNRGNVQEFQF